MHKNKLLRNNLKNKLQQYTVLEKNKIKTPT